MFRSFIIAPLFALALGQGGICKKGPDSACVAATFHESLTEDYMSMLQTSVQIRADERMSTNTRTHNPSADHDPAADRSLPDQGAGPGFLQERDWASYVNTMCSDIGPLVHRSLCHSEQLASFLESVSNLFAISKETKALLKSFRPCATCKQHSRYGESNDGGYIMCDDFMQPNQLKAAYSYGISGFDGWGNDVAKKFKIPVFQYDCFNTEAPEMCDTCDAHFNAECLNSNDGAPKDDFATLSQHMKRNGHEQVGQLTMLLKVDIEGDEWQFFAEEPQTNLQKFRQIVVEFHHLGHISEHPSYLKGVSNILGAGFVVDHIHGNNNGDQENFGDYLIPSVLEVTYLQLPNTTSKCKDHSVRLPEDAMNAPYLPDIDPPDAVLPMMQRSVSN